MAALLAKKFIINNGAKTKILIVYPPTLEKKLEGILSKNLELMRNVIYYQR